MSETHKSIRFVDFDGHHMGLSNEEAMSRRLNNWKGWKCSAGLYNMHVSADGNIFAATCKVGGMLGNVYDDRFKLSDRWTTCSKEWCMCGQDMQLPKARKESFLPYVLEDPPGKEVNHLSSVDWVAPYHMESFRQYPYFITWDLGRRCNYACDYCLPSLSNTYEAHKSWGSLKHAADNIVKNFSKGSPARWIFTGGEPTINPSFMDLVKYLHEKGHNLHTQTNGSRTAEYHAELIQYSCVGISLHLPYYKEDKFLKLCRTVFETQAKNKQAAMYWFGVRIMVPPGKFAQAYEIKQKMQALDGFDRFGHVYMSPLYGAENHTSDQIQDYNPQEYKEILAHM